MLNAEHDEVVGCHDVRAVEWRSSGEELVHEDPEGPVVDGNVVPLTRQNLWRNVVWCAAECPCLLVPRNALRKAKVNLGTRGMGGRK